MKKLNNLIQIALLGTGGVVLFSARASNFVAPPGGTYNFESVSNFDTYSQLLSKQAEILLSGAAIESLDGGLTTVGNIFPANENDIPVSFSQGEYRGIKGAGLSPETCPGYTGNPATNRTISNPFIVVSYHWAHNKGLGLRANGSVIKKDCVYRAVAAYYVEVNSVGELECKQQSANTEACFKY